MGEREKMPSLNLAGEVAYTDVCPFAVVLAVKKEEMMILSHKDRLKKGGLANICVIKALRNGTRMKMERDKSNAWQSHCGGGASFARETRRREGISGHRTEGC